MPTLIMYWGRDDGLGSGADITIENNVSPPIEIPEDACGFRLERPGNEWTEAWYFSPSSFLSGRVIEYNQVPLSSTALIGLGASVPNKVEAIGPVRACTEGEFKFTVSLGPVDDLDSIGIIQLGAQSFVADFTEESDITWLDSAYKPIPKPKTDDLLKRLPKNYFAEDPSVKGCVGGLDAAEDDCLVPEIEDLAPNRNRAAFTSDNIRQIIAANSGTIASVRSISSTSSRARRTTRIQGKIEIDCPADFVLTATFYKDAGSSPAIVEYRFRWAHGPISTIFKKRVDKDGENTFRHVVSIPLPPPINRREGGDGTTSGVGAAVNVGTIVINRNPESTTAPPSGSASPGIAVVDDFQIAIEPLPDNEHRSSVRVEVLNLEDPDEIVVSEWFRYHFVCKPRFRPGLVPDTDEITDRRRPD